MLRREFLASAVAQVLLPQGWGSEPSGWIPGARTVSFGKTQHLCGFGESKVACLWKPYRKVVKTPLVSRQQAAYDCVAAATAHGMDLLAAIQIAHGKAEQWITKSSIDAIYAGGRNNISHGYAEHGMRGSWAIDYLKEYGNLLMKKYGDYDLSKYSEATSTWWEDRKLPEFLLHQAKKHPLLDYDSVKSWSEIRDAVSAGYPILFCANMGARNSKRDKDGFIKPEGEWYHAWCIIGVDDGRRPGACLLNSHGPNWGSGPKRHGQPDGSVWVDAKNIEKYMLYGEAHALSSYKGFPAPDRKYILW
jgi:hypothetical protein